jgi:hypothetical protein
MSVGFVKSIAALLVGTGFALAQSPMSAVGTTTSRGLMTQPPVRTDISYPETSGQKTYNAPVDGEVTATPDGHLGAGAWCSEDEAPCRVYGSAELLFWRIRQPTLPSLTTIQPVGVVPVPVTITNNGEQIPPTSILVQFTLNNDPGFPSQTVDLGDHAGGRATLGWWLDAEQDLGFEISGFWLEKLTQQSLSTSANVTNQFVLDTGVQNQTFITTFGSPPELVNSTEVLLPAQGTSTVFVAFSSQLWGAEANLRCLACRVGSCTFGGLVGTRYLDFKENLRVANAVDVTEIPGEGTPVTAGVLPASFSSLDRIDTRNQIVAPQVGLNFDARCYGFFLEADGKLALGANFQDVDSAGVSTATTVSGGTRSTLGGLLTGPADQGSIHRTRVVFVPEVNVKVGYEFANWARVFIGYDALNMDHVVRPGNQVSFTEGLTQLQVANSTASIPLRQPIIRISDQNVWVQGINVGFELRY